MLGESEREGSGAAGVHYNCHPEAAAAAPLLLMLAQIDRRGEGRRRTPRELAGKGGGHFSMQARGGPSTRFAPPGRRRLRMTGNTPPARVRSIELLRLGREGYNDRRFDGTVVSFDRRDNILTLQTDSGRTINVDVQNFDGRLRRGDRVFVSGRLDRDSGNFIADRVRVRERY